MVRALNKISVNMEIAKLNAINKVKKILTKENGEFYVDKMMTVVIAIVLGVLLLVGMKAIFGDEKSGLLKTVSDKITDAFNT